MKGNLFLILIVYTMLAFLTATLLNTFFFRMFPEKAILSYIVSTGAGLIFALLGYLPIKHLMEKE